MSSYRRDHRRPVEDSKALKDELAELQEDQYIDGNQPDNQYVDEGGNFIYGESSSHYDTYT